MTRAWHLAIVSAAVIAGCGPQPAVSTPGGIDLVVLTADPGGGAPGRASVTNPRGTVDLTAAGATATVVSASAPVASTMNEAEIATAFGDTFGALPLPPRSGTLYFRFESDQLTPESEALVPKLLGAVVSRPAPEVMIVGHTDTVGDPAINRALGLSRANAVRGLLMTAGLDPTLVEVVSHGESELLVPTADDTPEPRNRRVEITVR